MSSESVRALGQPRLTNPTLGVLVSGDATSLIPVLSQTADEEASGGLFAPTPAQFGDLGDQLRRLYRLGHVFVKTCIQRSLAIFRPGECRQCDGRYRAAPQLAQRPD